MASTCKEKLTLFDDFSPLTSIKMHVSPAGETQYQHIILARANISAPCACRALSPTVVIFLSSPNYAATELLRTLLKDRHLVTPLQNSSALY